MSSEEASLLVTRMDSLQVACYPATSSKIFSNPLLSTVYSSISSSVSGLLPSRETTYPFIPAFWEAPTSLGTSLKNDHSSSPVRFLISSYPFSMSLFSTPRVGGSKSPISVFLGASYIHQSDFEYHLDSYEQRATSALPHFQKNKCRP